MNTQAWGLIFAIGAAYLFLLAKVAGKKAPKPDPKPAVPEIVLAWRYTLDADKNLDTIAVYMHPETEEYLARNDWAKLP